MWRVERSRGIGEKASKKRRAIVGIGLVLEERRKTVRMEERKNRVGGEGRVVVGREEGQSQRDDGRVNEKKKRRGEGKRGVPGGNEPLGVTSGQRPPSAACVCAYPPRKGHAVHPRAILLASSTPRISGENP